MSNLIAGRFIYHSDRDSQYANNGFTDNLKEDNHLVVRLIGRKGKNCRDKWMGEEFAVRAGELRRGGGERLRRGGALAGAAGSSRFGLCVVG